MVDNVREIVRADGAVLRVETGGEGAPIVFLHGTLAGRSAFSPIRPHFGADHQLVLVAQRGHEGTPAVFPADYGLDTTEVADLAVVLEELRLDHVDIVGHSTGGAIGLAFALAYPERVRRLVLIEPSVLSLLVGEVASRVRAESEAVVAAADRGDDRAAVAAVLAIAGGERWAGLPDAARAKTLDALASVEAVTGPHFQALLDLAVAPQDVAALDIPMLLIYGDSTIWFESHIAARFGELRPDAAQIVIEGATHNSHVERPDVVGPKIAAFLSAP
jgi:pimeloyl-ACP methyl ester carboxylesterase